MNIAPTSDTSPAVEVTNVQHRFKDRLALKGVSFTVNRRELHGFVGPNGAGKTTALKLICTLLQPQRGSVMVFGQDVVHSVRAVRRSIGFMPDHFSMYRQMTVFEYLDFFGAAYGLSLKDRDGVIQDVLELTDMTGRRSSLISGLSRGMQQRVNLARVLVNDPDLLLLDEPASGLDPRARIELMDILRALQNMGKTIFISSHILSELADLCDSVTIIDRGTIKFSGRMDALLERDNTDVAVRLSLVGDADQLISTLKSMPSVKSAESLAEGNAEFRVIPTDASDSNALIAELLEKGITIRSLVPDRKHLNQAFMDLTQGGVS